MSALELDFGGDFLEHSTRASGSGFLKNWKQDGRAVVWIHPTAPIYSLWSHNWYRYSEEEDKERNETFTAIRGRRINCLEPEPLLKKQRWREDDGRRTVPPQLCPVCLCLEWIREQITLGKLELSTPVFRFEVHDPNLPKEMQAEAVVLCAGGMTGLFQKDKLSAEEVAQMRKAGVKQSESYLQNCTARQQYLFALVSDADLDTGWVLDFEAQTLGDKMKKAIRDEIKRCEGDVKLGSPKYNPYPFEWNYDENKQFSDRYDVVAHTRKRPSAKLEEMFQQEPPDCSRVIEPPKLGTLLDSMKQAAQIEIPLDRFFERAVQQLGLKYEDEGGAEEVPSRTPASSSTPTSREEAPADEAIGCDVCQHPMAETDLVCGGCAATYETDETGVVFLASRPCGNCRAGVAVLDGRCTACGAVHDREWNFELPAAPRRTSRTSRITPAVAAPVEPAVRLHPDAKPAARAAARRKGSR